MSDALSDQIARLSIAVLQRRYYWLLHDTSSDEVEIERLARRVLPADWLAGDSYAVPGSVEIVERLVQEIEGMRGTAAQAAVRPQAEQ